MFKALKGGRQSFYFMAADRKEMNESVKKSTNSIKNSKSDEQSD